MADHRRVGFDLRRDAASRAASLTAALLVVTEGIPIEQADRIVHSVLSQFGVVDLAIVESPDRAALLGATLTLSDH